MKIGKLGQAAITSRINDAAQESSKVRAQITIAFELYKNCDWGKITGDDAELNNAAVEHPGSDRIMARYATDAGDIYIITEADRSHTTILFADEY